MGLTPNGGQSASHAPPRFAIEVSRFRLGRHLRLSAGAGPAPLEYPATSLPLAGSRCTVTSWGRRPLTPPAGLSLLPNYHELHVRVLQRALTASHGVDLDLGEVSLNALAGKQALRGAERGEVAQRCLRRLQQVQRLALRGDVAVL